MKNLMRSAKRFFKFSKRHWKLFIGAACSCTGMYLMTQGEYETGLKDGSAITKDGILKCLDLPRNAPQSEYYKAWKEGTKETIDRLY